MKIKKTTKMKMLIRDKLSEFTDNLVMGILNVTPDSFYDKSRVSTDTELLKTAERMLSEGADILDLGGYSSRPGANDISIREEISRIQPSIRVLRREFPEALISLDTFRSQVAQLGLDEGIDIINDISAGHLDVELPKIVAEHKVPYIIMHMRGTPQTMQSMAEYENITQELFYYFNERIRTLHQMGIHDLIIDPGFGFAKTVEDNYEIIENLEIFKKLECPILVGISRKSFIQKKFKVSINETLTATNQLHKELLMKGAQIIRTHDVGELKLLIEELKTML
ncbi:MAG: dihydropteroate synthase [Crocinitomicaceae bacterium]|nr:dihydropteroate synthase [Crocinitomicaceae bacterium]